MLPNVRNAAIAAEFLQSKGLLHTLSVLRDEVEPAVLEEGENELAAL
jgi:hypothetical protein